MRVLVTGASGNVGTALLATLRESRDVEAVVAIARRTPRQRPPAPYDVATWVSVDVGGPDGSDVVSTLVGAMAGVDAVVHLAWAIQPSHDRERLRRTNVTGTTRVLEAARLARIPHVVIASSVGAYSPARDDEAHGESWPARGVETSAYSVDKAEVERVLDDHERQHPELLITRLRPALIFQRAAGSQMVRYFMGPWVPRRALRGHVPVLPWPAGLRLQAVHADDAAQAYLAALRTAPGGAFNIAAAGVLGGQEVADVVSGGRWREIPAPAARAAVAAAWSARAVPVSPGWIDMGLQAPMMSVARARTELDWSPRHTATEVLAEVVEGIAQAAGTASPPMRPR